MRPAASTVALLAMAAGVGMGAPVPRYAVIFDAGSTGTRVHIYAWRLNDNASPTVSTAPGWSEKVSPGISSFFPDNAAGAGESILPLLATAERVVPALERARCIVMLRATAGMRLIPRRAQAAIYDSLHNTVITRSGFRPARADFATLSGSEEGIFGWLATNHLLVSAGLLSASRLGAVGAIDLGGGSTQITIPTSDGLGGGSSEDVSIINLPGRSAALGVYSHSHLGFGNKQAISAMTKAEAASCLARGAHVNGSWALALGGSSATGRIHGKAQPAKCEAAIRRVLARFDRGSQPAVGGGATSFIAMSLFFFATHYAEIAGHLPRDSAGTHTVEQLGVAANALCGEHIDALLERTAGKDSYTAEGAIAWRCFDLLYATWLLRDGYGFAPSDKVTFTGDIGGTEVEWTLGALHARLGERVRSPRGHPYPGYGRRERFYGFQRPLMALGVLLILCVGHHLWAERGAGRGGGGFEILRGRGRGGVSRPRDPRKCSS